MNPEELNAILLKWRGVFAEYGLDFIIYQSMCLGLIRQGSFYNERVAEFAVIGAEIEPVLEAMKADKRLGFFNENHHAAPVGLLYFSDAEVQPIYFKNGKAVYNLESSTCLVFDEALLRKENWSTYRYMDLDWHLPGNPERYLEQAYGEKWRIPNPAYGWFQDANNRINWDEI